MLDQDQERRVRRRHRHGAGTGVVPQYPCSRRYRMLCTMTNVVVGVLAMRQVPFERVLGVNVGRFMQQLHEANRVWR